MREALFLFRKDVRHFRLPLAGFLALMGLLGGSEAVLPRRPDWFAASLACQWLLIPAAWYLVVLVIHEQKLPGDRQYWLTRPYPRRSLLLAKALFVVVFLNLPLLVSQVVALAANGLAPLAYWRALAARQFFFTALTVLPAAALATVTASLAQFGMGAFAVFGIVLLIELGGGHPPGQWGGLDWIESSAVVALAFVVSAAVVLLQYTRRATLLAASILAGGVVACSLLPALDLWSLAFSLQEWLSPQPADVSQARLQFDAARDPTQGRNLLRSWPDHPEAIGLAMPIQLTGLPAGISVLNERTLIAIQAPGGASWESGWQPPPAESRALRTADPFPLLAVNRAFFDSIKDQPVRLQIRAAFTFFGTPSTTTLPVPAEDRWVPGAGFCWTSPSRVACFSPFAHAAWVEGEARPAPPSAPEPAPLRPEISYAPYPTNAGFGLWKTDLEALWMREMPWKAIAIQTRQARAHLELDLEIPQVRLAPYAGVTGGANP